MFIVEIYKGLIDSVYKFIFLKLVYKIILGLLIYGNVCFCLEEKVKIDYRVKLVE